MPIRSSSPYITITKEDSAMNSADTKQNTKQWGRRIQLIAVSGMASVLVTMFALAVVPAEMTWLALVIAGIAIALSIIFISKRERRAPSMLTNTLIEVGSKAAANERR
jgi:uncharacterized membrane protein